MAIDFDFLAARGLTGACMAGGLEDDFSGDEERIRALRLHLNNLSVDLD